MDADEFLKKVAPLAPRSRLAPYWGDIVKLRAHGCTLDQVREFLAVNQVQISMAGLSQYIRRREAKEASGGVSEHISVAPKPATARDAPEEPRKIANPADLRKSRKREIDLDDYLNPEGT